jgi:hypothetical protein
MTSELKQRWIDALLSGKYRQGVGKLRTETNEYCCLGVLCDISGAGEWQKRDKGWYYVVSESADNALLPTGIADELRDGMQSHLSYRNDQGDSFKQIVEFIKDRL